MKRAIHYAAVRWYKLAKDTFALLGLLGAAILIMPAIELKLAPPVTAWQIVDAKRDGNMLRWFVIVEKKRDCRSTVRWIGRSNGEILPLRGAWPDGDPADGSRVRVEPGEKGRFGPISAPVPMPWRDARDISIDADVVYNCGMPWALPAVPVEEAIAR